MNDDLIKRVTTKFVDYVDDYSYVDAMKRALAECGATVEQDWQPIETAPSVRGYIDGYCEANGYSYRVHWHGEKWCEVGTNYALPVPLTHWRPLPARPGGKP